MIGIFSLSDIWNKKESGKLVFPLEDQYKHLNLIFEIGSLICISGTVLNMNFICDFFHYSKIFIFEFSNQQYLNLFVEIELHAKKSCKLFYLDILDLNFIQYSW